MRAAGVEDARIENAFATVPREAFLPPPPWTTISFGVASTTTSISDLYENVLVAIAADRGINNGEPSLHAAWLAAVHPAPGETIVHVGAGLGYYTAIMALLVRPGGHVSAYEYQPDLAAEADANLAAYPEAAVQARSALRTPLPDCDIVYVNAGVSAPDPEWLKALKPGGRLIFPWQPGGGWGPTILVTHLPAGFEAVTLMNVGFIACRGETTRESFRTAAKGHSQTIRSVWRRTMRKPDESAVAVYDEVWFSSEPLR